MGVAAQEISQILDKFASLSSSYQQSSLSEHQRPTKACSGQSCIHPPSGDYDSHHTPSRHIISCQSLRCPSDHGSSHDHQIVRACATKFPRCSSGQTLVPEQRYWAGLADSCCGYPTDILPLKSILTAWTRLVITTLLMHIIPSASCNVLPDIIATFFLTSYFCAATNEMEDRCCEFHHYPELP
jgi:hypothetical protein